MYQALYRKWRPRTFDDVVGQEHITETLKNQISTDRLSHAYLFIGTRGTGKTTCAKILAKAVNCENPVNGNPCNRCRSCLGIDDGSVMDVVEMDAASNNGVDSVRALRDEAVFSPASVKKRVYIIDEVHMLSASAFNALLKILEEPPEHLMFILATTELHKVLPTILSRCQRHSFKRLDPHSIEKRLMYVAKEEALQLSSDAARLIAGLAEGGMRDALSILDQCSGRERIDTDTVYSAMGLAGSLHICRMLQHIQNHDTPSAIGLFTELWRNGKDPATLLGELSSLLREILMRAVAPKGSGQLLSGCYDERSLASFAGSFSTGELVNNINIIQSALADMRSGQARTICELCLITLCEPELGDDLPLIRQRVAKLEQSIKELASRPAAVVQQATPAAIPGPAAPSPFASAGHDDTGAPPLDDEEPPFDTDVLAAAYGMASPAEAENEAPPFDIDAPEEEYTPEAEADEDDEFYYLTQLPPIPELPPLPGDEEMAGKGDPRAALMSFSTQTPQRIQPEAAPEDLPFDLDVPSFMREAEDDRPRAPVEIKRKIYFDEAAAPPEAKEAFSVPEPAPVPASASAPKSLSDGEIWEKAKNSLAGNMPLGLHLLLTDPTQVDAYLSGGELILSVKSSFAMNMLNRPDIVAKVASAASSIAGRSIAARMVDADKAPPPSAPSSPKTDKLDELGRFEVVTFK